MTKNQKIIAAILVILIVIIAIAGFIAITNQAKTEETINKLIKVKLFTSQNKPTEAPKPTMAPATDESPTFIDTVWTANSISNADPINGTSITVQFDNKGKVFGFDGCNNFNTTYTTDGTSLTITPSMASTLKACSEDIMKQADTFNKLFIASTSYKLGDGVLALNQGDSTGLTFTGASNPLAKTSWDVTGYNNGREAVVGPITNTTPTMVFGDDGTISGSAGCNTYSGNYTLNGESISISTLAVTQRECIEPEGIMEQEASFITYLEKSETYQLSGNQLTLRTAEDQIAVTATSAN